MQGQGNQTEVPCDGQAKLSQIKEPSMSCEGTVPAPPNECKNQTQFEVPKIMNYDFYNKNLSDNWNDQKENLCDYFNYGLNEDMFKKYSRKIKNLVQIVNNLNIEELKTSTVLPIELGGLGPIMFPNLVDRENVYELNQNAEKFFLRHLGEEFNQVFHLFFTKSLFSNEELRYKLFELKQDLTDQYKTKFSDDPKMMNKLKFEKEKQFNRFPQEYRPRKESRYFDRTSIYNKNDPKSERTITRKKRINYEGYGKSNRKDEYSRKNSFKDTKKEKKKKKKNKDKKDKKKKKKKSKDTSKESARIKDETVKKDTHKSIWNRINTQPRNVSTDVSVTAFGSSLKKRNDKEFILH